MAEQNMIQMTNVSKWYGPVQVLNNASVQVNKGDVVVVCGPSGAHTLICSGRIGT